MRDLQLRKPLLAGCVLVAACAFEPQVLTPDPVHDAGYGPIQGEQPGDGDGDPGVGDGDGDIGSGDGDGDIGSGDGDGDLGGGDGDGSDGGAPIGTDGGMPAEPKAKDPECDFNGVWIARQNTESLALGGLPQYANNWYYFELRQDGEQVTVVEHFDCGIEVQGNVLVQLSPETTKGLMAHNRQIGRKGTLKKQSDGTCAFEFGRFWNVRGVSESQYLPNPRTSTKSIADVAAEQPLPKDAALSEDWDGDGQPGVRWNVSGIVSGARHTAQRDWNRWFTDAEYKIVGKTNWDQDLVLRAEFSNEEVIYKADFGLNQLSTPNATAKHTVTLRFLGRTLDDPRAKAIRKSDDFQTCLAIQQAIKAIKGLK